jgi:16S rRNA (guanine527-N7)-methyltransferase
MSRDSLPGTRSAHRPGSRNPEPPQSHEGFARLLERARALEPDASDALARFLAELDSWRRRINLTGRLSAEQLVEHALESIPAAGLIAEGAKVVDIGSGSGFPAIPLAILRREAAFTLFEPVAKKAAFLRHAARSLPLANVAVHAARIEDAGGATFDAATTRAVGSLGALIGRARFLRPGGRLLVWTTDAGALARDLPAFGLAKSIPIAGSRAKEIAVFEKPPL